MQDPLHCYRCGASLAPLSLPLSRLDECPSCRAQLHVCRMCRHYAPGRPEDCDEDDAPPVRDKRSANFCDYFVPDPAAGGSEEARAEAAARARLTELFGGGDTTDESRPTRPSRPADTEPDSAAEAARRAAEALFKK